MTTATTPRKRRAAKAPARRVAASPPPGHAAVPQLPETWRPFVGQWLEQQGSALQPAARGDWEVELAPDLQRRWRRQRVRLVFDPQRATLPRGAWFTAPGSAAGRKLLLAAMEPAMCTRRTALAQVPGAPAEGIAAVCKVRGLSWGVPRLGPVRYERRVAFHGVITRWGGLPLQESWVVVVDCDGKTVERAEGSEIPGIRSREGLYQIPEPLAPGECADWAANARAEFGALLEEREAEWEASISRLRDDELGRLGAFYSARIGEEEDRVRRRTSGGEDAEMEAEGDATSLKLDWERRAAEVRQRWSIRTEIRIWGVCEWSWPVAELEQELRSGAVHVRLRSAVDVARGAPALPGCPSCGEAAEMLVRARGGVHCVQCAPA